MISRGKRLAITDNEGREKLTAVFEMFENGTFRDIFESFGEDLSKLSFTDEEQCAFCKKYAEELEPYGWANIFLVKRRDKFVIVIAYKESGIIQKNESEFDSTVYLRGNRHLRVIVPQQEKDF